MITKFYSLLKFQSITDLRLLLKTVTETFSKEKFYLVNRENKLGIEVNEGNLEIVLDELKQQRNLTISNSSQKNSISLDLVQFENTSCLYPHAEIIWKNFTYNTTDYKEIVASLELIGESCKCSIGFCNPTSNVKNFYHISTLSVEVGIFKLDWITFLGKPYLEIINENCSESYSFELFHKSQTSNSISIVLPQNEILSINENDQKEISLALGAHLFMKDVQLPKGGVVETSLFSFKTFRLILAGLFNKNKECFTPADQSPQRNSHTQ